MTIFLEHLKKINHEHLHSIWKAAQTGDIESLPEEDRQIAALMLEHEEYHNQFEMADVLHATSTMSSPR